MENKFKKSKQGVYLFVCAALMFTLLFSTVGQVFATNGESSTTDITTLPGTFYKNSPSRGATGIVLNPTLSWGYSAGARYYEYCIDTSNDNTCSNWINVGLSTKVTKYGLYDSTKYFWQVRAVNYAGTTYANKYKTNFWQFKTGYAAGPFNKQSIYNGSTNVGSSVLLNWSKSSGATRYEYCIDTTNDGGCSTSWISVGSATQTRVRNLSRKTTYYWQVRATNIYGKSFANADKNTFWKFTTATIPAPFTKKGIANGATGVSVTPTISWVGKTPYTKYEYCIDTVNDKKCTTSWITTGTGTSASLALDSATTYYWQVRATNSFGTTYGNGGLAAFWKLTTE